MRSILPDTIANRKDKMGFPTPLTEWFSGEVKEFLRDVFSSKSALTRELINNRKALDGIAREVKYGRKIWGMLCLELWQQEFPDKEYVFQELLRQEGVLQ
jgi:asparagine synthase (glutamine-hydrolysing)